MSATTLTSELEAVNTMLDCIGESPVSSLASSGLVEVAKAKNTLNEISRLVQAGDFHFNTEDDYPLEVDSDSNINLPANTLSVDETSQGTAVDVVARGLRLYDRKNHTYVFTAPLKATIKFLLPWDELPQPVRHYVMIRASRVYQARELGSDTQFRFSEAEEGQALVSMVREDLKSADCNMLSGSFSTFSIINR